MNLLAFDTSTDVGSVAVLHEGRLVAQHLLRAPMNLLSWLSPAVRHVLDEAGLDIGQIDAVAAGIGPGSFTGVRLELATARTLAQVRGIPLYGVSSLETLAYQALPHEGMILSCVDARRGELFAGFFRASGMTLEREGEYVSLPPDAVAREACRHTGPWIMVGENNPYRAVLLQSIPGAREASPSAGIIQAASVGGLAYAKRRSQSGDMHAVAPLYIRASNAEIEKRKAAT